MNKKDIFGLTTMLIKSACDERNDIDKCTPDIVNFTSKYKFKKFAKKNIYKHAT